MPPLIRSLEPQNIRALIPRSCRLRRSALQFLLEFGILFVVHMLNGFGAHYRTHSVSLIQTGGVRLCRLEPFLFARKINQTSPGLIGVGVVV